MAGFGAVAGSGSGGGRGYGSINSGVRRSNGRTARIGGYRPPPVAPPMAAPPTSGGGAGPGSGGGPRGGGIPDNFFDRPHGGGGGPPNPVGRNTTQAPGEYGEAITGLKGLMEGGEQQAIERLGTNLAAYGARGNQAQTARDVRLGRTGTGVEAFGRQRTEDDVQRRFAGGAADIEQGGLNRKAGLWRDIADITGQRQAGSQRDRAGNLDQSKLGLETWRAGQEQQNNDRAARLRELMALMDIEGLG